MSGSASSRDLTPDERELAEALRISKATAKARVGIWEREQWSIGFDEGARAMRNLLALAGRPDEEQPRITDTMVEAAWTVLNGEPVEPEWEEAFVKKASLRAALEAALGAVASPLPADAREIVEAMAEAPMTKWSVHWITKARELLGMEPRYVTVDSPPVAGPADQGGRP